MSDTFWCRGCQRHKKVSARSPTQKIGGALCCASCEENVSKLFTPQGAKIQARRIADANRRTDHFARHLEEHCTTL
jgi:hypothetical protein